MSSRHHEVEEVQSTRRPMENNILNIQNYDENFGVHHHQHGYRTPIVKTVEVIVKQENCVDENDLKCDIVDSDQFIYEQSADPVEEVTIKEESCIEYLNIESCSSDPSSNFEVVDNIETIQTQNSSKVDSNFERRKLIATELPIENKNYLNFSNSSEMHSNSVKPTCWEETAEMLKMCKFCYIIYASLQYAQWHKEFYCPFQKTCRIRCEVCNKVVPGPVEFTEHVAIEHKEMKNYDRLESFYVKVNADDECVKQSNETPGFHSIKKLHPRRAHKKKLKKVSSWNKKCRFCNRTFQNTMFLTHHEHDCKGEKSHFFCKNCGSHFSEYNQYMTHQRHCCKSSIKSNKLENQPRSKFQVTGFTSFYLCGICDKNDFRFPSVLYSHLRLHTEVNIFCNLCKISFDDYGEFRSHLKKGLYQPLYCTFSGKDGSKNDVNVNLTTEQKGDTDNADTAVASSENDLLSCNVCHQIFPEVSQLVTHIQKHLECEYVE